MNIGIQAIEYYLPQKVLSNVDLVKIFPDWTEEKIYKKTGIKNRHIAADDEYVSDLAFYAAKRLFENNSVEPKDIDFVILFTQSPDYNLPTTACILQDRLKIPKSAGALDINLGCSAFIYGLAVAKSLINTKIATNILLITAETYSKYINPKEKSVVTIFGDGAAATLISPSQISQIKEFDLGTDGSGAEHLIAASSGARLGMEEKCIRGDLFMNGPEIFNFTIDVVPKSIDNVLKKNNLTYNDIDYFVFHQANSYMLDHLRKKCNISEDKFYVDMSETGNTVSSTIPIALYRAQKEGHIKKGDTILLVGFGVGLSWGSTVIIW
ncbi:3-oxoacyl-ACP synthase [Paenibacillus silvae]|uniref:3-oxoacyl-ACP synthase n=1 Tax=Paenibacillus silvae TaxID=1325358 RepID=A0ABQ1ZFX0_9BACL|nr:ketoacyl-ACP synthase III [Paenibacillus silvae]GGH64373.1 3-oxoacyl-ACP synthase [Paenibacillus silvae]